MFNSIPNNYGVVCPQGLWAGNSTCVENIWLTTSMLYVGKTKKLQCFIKSHSTLVGFSS